MTKEEEKKRCLEIQEKILQELEGREGITDEEISECVEEYVLKLGHTVYLSIEKRKR